jgi:hypothetical protein
MADQTTNIQQIVAGAGADQLVNENFDAATPAMLFARRAGACAGLVWGYYGGRWSGLSIANGTLTMTASTTNYITVNLANGAVSTSTSTTVWNDTANNARAYQVITGGASVTDYQDWRAGSGGTINAVQTGVSPVGRHLVPISATSMIPSSANGCANLAQVAGSANAPDYITMNFSNGTDSNALLSMSMPKSWNEGTVSAKFVWSQSANSAGNASAVVWAFQAVALRGNSAIATAYGTAQSVTSNGGTANTLYVSAETPALTIGNSPQAEDTVFFRVRRLGTSGSDNLAQAARLHEMRLYINTDAGNDA